MPESQELRRVLDNILANADSSGGFQTVLARPETHAQLLRTLVMLHRYQDRQIAELQQKVRELEG